MSSTCEELELSRDELLDMLQGMKINLGTTKLPISHLQHRLNKALDAALAPCNFPKFGFGRIDVQALPRWDKCSLMEAFAHLMVNEWVNTNPSSNHRIAAFHRLLEHIMSLVTLVDTGSTPYMVFGTGNDEIFRHILVKFLPTVRKGDDVPLLVVQYRVVHSRNSEEYNAFFHSVKAQCGGLLGDAFMTSLYEQEILLRLFERNNQRLPDHLQQESSDGFRLSFLAPVTTLQSHDIARLSKNTGCVVCGRNTKHLCDCRNVQYCSAACQKKDWKQHKATCKPLSTGVWHDVTLDVALTGVNQFGCDDPRTERIACKSIVLLKLEIPALNKTRILTTDQSQTMKMAMRKEHNKEAWAAALKAYGKETTIYRWACRVRYYEWRICFDRVPQVKPSW